MTKKSDELADQLAELDAKAAELEQAEAAAESGLKKNEIRGQRWRIEEQRLRLVGEHDQALAAEVRQAAEATELSILRRDTAGAVTAIEADVASIQAATDAVLAGFAEVDTEIKALVTQMRDISKRAGRLYPQCEKFGLAPPRVALTPAIRAFGKLGADYRI